MGYHLRHGDHVLLGNTALIIATAYVAVNVVNCLDICRSLDSCLQYSEVQLLSVELSNFILVVNIHSRVIAPTSTSHQSNTTSTLQVPER